MKQNKTLILVDGSSYLYRAYHALPPLTTSKGEPTGAVFGVINMLRKLRSDFPSEHIGVIFDPKGKTFRDELYSEYKAQRPSMPDELQAQIQPLFNIIRAMGLPLIIVDGFEADDVIATFANSALSARMHVRISTTDKDLAQLVNEHIELINTMNNTTLNRQGVIEKYGVEPEQIVDYLALIGDTSDNIPGIPGVGPKTAAKWLQKYGSIDKIVANASEISGKVGENLRANLERLPLNCQLITVNRQVNMDTSLEALTPKPADEATLREIFTQLEFNQWLKELSKSNDQVKQHHYHKVLTVNQLEQWLRKIKEAGLFSFDTETTDLDYMVAELVGVSFAVNKHEAAYVPLQHDYQDAPKQIDFKKALSLLKPVLENQKLKKIGHNLKYDMSVLARYDIKLSGVEHDTMLESYVLNSTASKHDMDTLAFKYLHHETIHYEDIAGKGTKQKTFNEIDIDTASEYAAEDADITLQLHETFWPQLPETVKKLYQEIEIPLVPVLSTVERNGVLLNTDLLHEQSKELEQRIAKLEQEAVDLAGESFNLGSPKQLQHILFEKLKLPVIRKTPKGQASTAEDVLQELAWDYPLPKLLLEHRALVKLKSTYVDKLPVQVNAATGRVHTSYHQAVAATGRLSSTNPNLQNIPVRTDEGRRVRQAFVAQKGHSILSADYSQIELRIMAHLSKDPALCDAFAQGKDIHRATAAEIFAQQEDQVDQNQRRSAKAINFGLIYGMSAFGLARQLGIERQAAQEYIDLYFERYPAVKQFMDDTRQQAKQREYVETLFGRRLYVPEIKSANFQRRQYAERTAINAPMQGTAADIIKIAMIKAHAWLGEQKFHAKMIMQVHDELVFEIPDAHMDACRQAIQACMSQAVHLSIPLVVDIGVGQNWDEAH